MDGFESMYRAGTPPWDIGRPQPVFVALQKAGEVRGRVLDAGCGTGEHVLHFAARGHEAWGIDGSPSAVHAAMAKARERRIEAVFRVHDALDLGSLGEAFDTITDSGLFHVFSDEDRPRYVASLRSALRDDGRVHILCFSEREPGDWGPRRVTREELRRAFAGWTEIAVEVAFFETNLAPGRAQAWRATFAVPTSASSGMRR